MSLGVTAVAVGLAGAAIGAYSAIQNGEAEKAAANYQSQVAANNATIANYNATAAVSQGNQQVQAEEQQAAEHQGMIRAVMGAGGLDLDSGSALRNQEGVAEVDAVNKATITSNAARTAWNFTNQGANYSATSQLETMQGEQAQTAGMMSGFSTMLSGAGTTANTWNKFYPSATS